MRIIRSVAIVSTATLGAIAIACSAAPAIAVEGVGLEAADAQAVVGRMAPGVLTQSRSGARSLDAAAMPEVGVSSTVDHSVAVSLADHPTVAIDVEGAQGAGLTRSGDFAVLSDGSSATYVEPTDGGARLLSYAASADTALDRAYDFDFGVAVAVEPVDAGGLIVRDVATGVPIGTFSEPWAVDARGQSLATHYVWENGRLEQKIDAAPESITYPVLSDPNWTYSLTYVLGASNATKVWNELHRCFNCNFAITGAPAKFPAVGQTMPLSLAHIGNASVHLDTWYNYTNPNVKPGVNSGFILVANSGHVDGAGSTINFDYLNRYTDNATVMTVNAFIKKDFIAGNGAYKEFAKAQWGVFAGRLQRNLGLPVSPGPAPTPS